MRTSKYIFEDEALDSLFELEALLKKGAQGSGLHLNADKCADWLAALHPPKPQHLLLKRTLDIYYACLGREIRGMSTKAAVEETKKQFNVSPATVYNARKIFSK